MKRLFAILFLCLVGWGIYYHLSSLAKRAAIHDRHERMYALITALKAAPAYKRLIERGEEKCPGQPDQTIWVCGATVRMPNNPFPGSASSQKCSSPEAPRYVGSFELPDVMSSEPETEGLRVKVNIPRFGGRPNARDGSEGSGRYDLTAFWNISAGDLPEFVPCDDRERDKCSSLWISGEREIAPEDAYFHRDVPDVLQNDRPAPEDIAYGNHPLMDDAFLNLDGNPVAYAVGHPSLHDGHYTCRFRMLHPKEGYTVGLAIDCEQVGDWRALLRGVISKLSERTITVTPGAQCNLPPTNARITPQAHWTSPNQHQAMHDWAVEWDAHGR